MTTCHQRAYISICCLGRRVPSVLLDNGSTLNICPLATTIALGYALSDFGHSTQTIQAYDNTRREVMGTLDPQSRGHSLFPSSEGEVHSRWLGRHSAVRGRHVYFYRAGTSDQLQ